MDRLKFRKIGNSVGATFPQEYLKHLGVESGDEVFITKEPDGRIVLSPYDPNFAATMEAYQRVKKRYRNALKNTRRSMIDDYYWLTKSEIIALHQEIIKDFGGLFGILNESALESTLYRPQQLVYYQPESNVFDLAATYGYGFVKNHCFVDGNKRIAFVVMAIFLLRNGYELTASEVEVVDIMINLAKGEMSQSELGLWLSNNSLTE